MRDGPPALTLAILLVTGLCGAACADFETDPVAATDGAESDPGAADATHPPPGCDTCVPGTAAPYPGDPTRYLVCPGTGRCQEVRKCPEGSPGRPQVFDPQVGACRPRVCDGGDFVRCTGPETERRCNPRGTGFVERACDGCAPSEEGDGDPSICVCRETEGPTGEGPGCAPVRCRPERDTACRDDAPCQCNRDGTAWDCQESCVAAGRGHVCEVTDRPADPAAPLLESPVARCVPLCEYVIKLRSYIGCEYWAADLDNAFTRGNNPSGYFDAQGRQFAVVVANVSGGDREFAARVEANRVDGPVWCKTWAPVAGFPEAPDTRYCYVNEGACVVGERCEIIIEHDEAGRRVPREICIPHEQGGGECRDHVTLGAGELRVLNLPRADLNGSMIGPLGYQIRSDAPITAYQFNPLANEEVFSNDASLLLPINALGSDYVIMSREQTFEILRPSIIAIAVRPGVTKVTVRTTAPTIPGAGIDALSVGDQRTFTLRQFDALNLETLCPADARGYCEQAVDFTGSEVFSDKVIAVFGGSEASNAPNTNHCVGGECWDGTECANNADCNRNISCCADHLEEQLLPVSAWGQHYVAARSHRRGDPIGTGAEPDVWRIVAGYDATTVRTFPTQLEIPELDRGEWVDFVSTEDFEIMSDKAVMVGQFLAAEHSPNPNVHGEFEEGDARTGDPAFILGVPVQQYRDEYVFLAPDRYEYDFCTVVAPAEAQVLLDGELIREDLFEPVGIGTFKAARVPIADGVHRMVSRGRIEGMGGGEGEGEAEATGPRPAIGVIVYGYDQYVSYGYPGGLNLERINRCAKDVDCPRGQSCCSVGQPCARVSLGECLAD